MRDPASQIDVRRLGPIEGRSELCRAFDALGPGEALILETGDPRPLLEGLQANRALQFDWNVLEAGPERFRINVRRRVVAGPRTVAELLGEDHRRLDGIVTDVKRRLAEGDFGEARAEFATFVCGLQRHIEAEEEVLFPALESAIGVTDGPTAVMRSEHLEIRRLMELAATALEDENASASAGAIGALTGILLAHNGKEERILYPMADRSAGDDRAREELVRRIQAV